MSRSFKKSPVVSPKSSKDFHAKANRRERRHLRTILHCLEDFDAFVLPAKREISEIWDGPKDGRCNMFGSATQGHDLAGLKKLLRK